MFFVIFVVNRINRSEVRIAKRMAPELRRTLGFRDLVLFYLATTLSLRWIATAAAVGPSALVIWVCAALGLFVPLVFTVLELSSRYPDEGGMYVWSKRAFGPFAGFITGWTYWSANLPYFPGLLYFAAANALFVGGPSAQALSSNSTYFLIVSFTGLAVAVGLNIVGLDIGKWMTNVSALAGWVPIALLIAFGFYSWTTYGSATPITAQSLLPSTGFKDVIFWSTMAFAFSGVESASTMGDEIVDARRTVPRAILTAAAFITIIYIVATLCVLLALPREQVSGPPGVHAGDSGDGGQGRRRVARACAGGTGLAQRVWRRGRLVCGNGAAAVRGWYRPVPAQYFCRPAPPMADAVRRPSRSGRDRRCIRRSSDRRARRVRGAYEVLVSMSIIGNFIPFLFMFGAMIKLQDEPAGAGGDAGAGGPGRRADPRRPRASWSARPPSCWRACPPTRSRIRRWPL